MKKIGRKIHPLECGLCKEKCENRFIYEEYYKCGYMIPVEACKKYYRKKYEYKDFNPRVCLKCNRHCYELSEIKAFISLGTKIPYRNCKKYRDIVGEL